MRPAGSAGARGGWSASALKYIAAATMLIDHLASVFLPGTSLLQFLLRCIGRLAFPIFAYFVAEGCAKTHDLPGYARRLFLFALASQLPFMLAFQSARGSVILTFFLAVAAISFYESACEHVGPVLAFLPALLPLWLAELTHSDYGIRGALLVLALYLCRNNRVTQYTLSILLLLDFYRNVYAVFACCALFLLSRYRGDRGSGNKWFFYWFYPLHLLLIWLIHIFL